MSYFIDEYNILIKVKTFNKEKKSNRTVSIREKNPLFWWFDEWYSGRFSGARESTKYHVGALNKNLLTQYL